MSGASIARVSTLPAGETGSDRRRHPIAAESIARNTREMRFVVDF
jgi:hypothetical protein